MKGLLPARPSLWLVTGVIALAVGCATSVELEPNQAYLLSRMGYTPGYQISGLELRNVDTGEDVVVKPGKVVLTRAAPGRYYVREIRYQADNVRSNPRPQPPINHFLQR